MLSERPGTLFDASTFERIEAGFGDDFNEGLESRQLAAEALLIRALVHEVQTAALLTAGAASAINAAEMPFVGRAFSEAKSAIVDFPARIDDWPQRILDEEISRDSFENIAVFYAAFNNAKSRLLAFEREADKIGLGRAMTLHIGPLSTAWRLASRHATIAIEELTTETAHILPDAYHANLRLLVNLLGQVDKGHWPCLKSDGTFHLPRLPERRRAPRRSMLQTADVRVGGTEFTAFVQDVSAGGFGLTRMPSVSVGAAMFVTLHSGRSFSGRVAWCEGSSVGMRFDRQLMPTDPLLFG
ncbi:MAG: PilZ domain-containing protein [Hyphomicrobiaceae bacterium]|nr:PilZ domain-containing protein [Hyphomicrobiaceae bacterium]